MLCGLSMIPELSNELLERLIEIGRRETFNEFEQLLADFPQARSGQIMRQPFSDWYDIASRFSRDELTALIKTFTIIEQDLPNFCGGSVSPVIPLYHYLLDSTQDDFAELRDWVVAHTQNHYLPFGSGRFRPASMADYHRQAAEHGKRRLEREREAELAVISRREARKKRQADQQNIRQRRRQSREVFLESLQCLSVTERLGHIIADTTRPVTFYPEEWANLDPATIKTLPTQLRIDAILRLSDRRTGKWKRLREQLEQSTS